eukprot:Skav221664  [mRNA]  locus=scaffold1750:273979:274372:+ [translate_table: standard]
MPISLNLGTATLKPEANSMDDQLPDDEVDEFSPRALYGTDTPCANRVPKVSNKAPRPKRTAAVVLEEIRAMEGKHPLNSAVQ